MKIENLKVYDLEESLIASGYPLSENLDGDGVVKQSDIERCLSSIKEGVNSTTGNQWLTGVTVSFDLTCSLTMWDEIKKNRIFDIVSGQEFRDALLNTDFSDMFIDCVDSRIKAVLTEKINKYKDLCSSKPASYNYDTWEKEKEKAYRKIFYNIPSGFELTNRVKTNYKSLLSLYIERHDDELVELKEFCDKLLELPIFKALVDSYRLEKKTDG